MRASLPRHLCASSQRSASALSRLQASPLASRIQISEEVKDALHRSQPLVSLESAITSHGLPYEQAVTVAKSLEDIIRSIGAVPAAIGLIDGIIKVGLTDAEVSRLAEHSETRTKWKVGRRDIAPALVKKVDGGTTVSATSFLSHLVGIDTFVTGGIGGVHRGAQQTMDISSDLTELGRTPVAVVCAGAKSILDIGLTLEYLETMGVTVTTFGQTDDFPAFYARKSGFKAPSHVRTAREAAELIYLSNMLNTQTGTLIGVPIPEEYEQKSIQIQKAVEQAVEESERNGIAKRGKEVTPWILAKVKELTGGESVESNIALIENNAKIGASIAVELARLKATESGPHPASLATPSSSRSAVKPADLTGQSSASEHSTTTSRLAVIGAAAVDIVSRPDVSAPNSTAPGTVSLTLGGVARNVFEAAYKTGARDAVLIAPIGEGQDPLSGVLTAGLDTMGARTDGFITLSGRTPSVNMILDENGDLLTGVADTGLVENLTAHQIIEKLERLMPRLVCFDGNLSVNAMKGVLLYCRSRRPQISTVFEPTSNAKALRILQAIDFEGVALDYMAPNVFELGILYDRIQELELLDKSTRFRSFILGMNSDETFRNQLRVGLPSFINSEGILHRGMHLLPFVRTLYIKLGKRGLLVLSLQSRESGVSEQGNAWTRQAAQQGTVIGNNQFGTIIIKHYPALPLEGTASVVGGGDSLLGALLAGWTQGLHESSPADLDHLVHIGQSAAIASLSSVNAVGDLSTVQATLRRYREQQKRSVSAKSS